MIVYNYKDNNTARKLYRCQFWVGILSILIVSFIILIYSLTSENLELKQQVKELKTVQQETPSNL